MDKFLTSLFLLKLFNLHYLDRNCEKALSSAEIQPQMKELSGCNQTGMKTVDHRRI